MHQPRFELTRVSGQSVADAELLADLRRVAQLLNATTVSIPQYKQHGTYSDTTISRRFESWNNAVLNAGLSIINQVDISDERLFENLLVLWQHYGRQPRRSELAFEPSCFSQSPYNRRFRGWTEALRAFVDYANSTEVELCEPAVAVLEPSKRMTGRDPSLRLRWKVFNRDNFKCCCCGKNPATTPGIELHVDHIIPWSKGGQTVLENLQILCSSCNLGKSNTH
jgi:5-methylcytosine-specific restriction endonuclease McrA